MPALKPGLGIETQETETQSDRVGKTITESKIARMTEANTASKTVTNTKCEK